MTQITLRKRQFYHEKADKKMTCMTLRTVLQCRYPQVISAQWHYIVGCNNDIFREFDDTFLFIVRIVRDESFPVIF